MICDDLEWPAVQVRVELLYAKNDCKQLALDARVAGLGVRQGFRCTRHWLTVPEEAGTEAFDARVHWQGGCLRCVQIAQG